MQQNVRYYIVKAEDQPVVRSVPVSRQHTGADLSRADAQDLAGVEGQRPKVSSVLRLALRRKRDSDVRA